MWGAACQAPLHKLGHLMSDTCPTCPWHPACQTSHTWPGSALACQQVQITPSAPKVPAFKCMPAAVAHMHGCMSTHEPMLPSEQPSRMSAPAGLQPRELPLPKAAYTATFLSAPGAGPALPVTMDVQVGLL